MTPAITLSDVGKTYPGPVPIKALAGIDLEVGAGDFVSIMGPSGSGKSTLLNMLGLLDRPTTGSVIVGGMDASRLSERERTRLRGRAVGFVFQAFELLDHRTVLDNVTMAGLYRGASAAERRRAALHALADVGLASRISAMPRELSGGERQRVAIARALAGGSDLLLCDEPTGNLDSRNAAQVGALLHDLNERGATVILVTHDADVAAFASRIVRVRDGRIDR